MSEPFTIRENDSGTADFSAFEGLYTPESSAASSECDAQEQEERLEEMESPDLDELVEAIDRAQVAPSITSGKVNSTDEKAKGKISKSKQARYSNNYQYEYQQFLAWEKSREVVLKFECSACNRKYGSLAELEKHQNDDWIVPNDHDIGLMCVGGPCFRANPKNKPDPSCAIQ